MVLKITEPQPQFGRVIVADYLPAGFEIDNPRLVSSGDTGTLSWIEDARRAGAFANSATTASPRRSSASRGSPPVFTVAYVVRAVSPGRYVLPQAYVEDMYRPDRFGRTGDRHDRGRRRRNEALARSSLAGAGGARRGRGASLAARGRSQSLGPAPLGEELDYLARRCSTATASCCAPTRPRTGAGGCRRRSKTSIRAFSRC